MQRVAKDAAQRATGGRPSMYIRDVAHSQRLVQVRKGLTSPAVWTHGLRTALCLARHIAGHVIIKHLTPPAGGGWCEGQPAEGVPQGWGCLAPRGNGVSASGRQLVLVCLPWLL